MPYLSCDAYNCAHNKENACTLSDIYVSGDGAKNVKSTCCENFTLKPTDTTTPDGVCECVDISCSARSCTYNSEGLCDAGDVCVGTQKAYTCGETECETFTLD